MASATLTSAPAASSFVNPHTPLALLDPATGSQYEASRHIFVAILGAFVCDILIYAPEDFALLFSHRLSTPTFTYFIARLSTLAHLICINIFQNGRVPSCNTLFIITNVALALGIASSSFLILLRMRVILEKKPYFVLFFAVLWVIALVCNAVTPLAAKAQSIQTTSWCYVQSVDQWFCVGFLVTFINDSLMCLGTSLALSSHTSNLNRSSSKYRLLHLFGLGSAPDVSNKVLLSSRQYYLITACGNALTIIMILLPVSPTIRAMFPPISIALMNSMACRVFRNIKFPYLRASPPNPIKTQAPHGRNIQIVYSSHQGYTNSYINPPDIQVSAIVEQVTDYNRARS
ncbi:hypothetical protein AMATHDRAFT_61778 [Amanita thiersii Skay4041]|uniref:G-protein coupled receptors family 1 profile domain-containing protein n=1 Tax=Amanita thiersii Skay4041 TaxID=703135 RepID=A0A2A9NLA6_9AGAR|nr:hypothetical protein AMATHDRAFT_61778 [Amanita thiersii Skay4041]